MSHLGVTCLREAEVLDLVAIEQWPRRASDELRAHVAACPHCADLVRVAVALTDDAVVALRCARVPDAGVVWRRAEVRIRQEEARQAVRPVTIAVLVAVACLVAVAAAGWWVVQPSVASWWLTAVGSVADVSQPSGWTWGLLAAAAGSALLPVAFYLARAFDRDDARSR